MPLDELRRAFRRLRAMLGRPDDDFDEELAAHLAMAEADLVAAGTPPAEARRLARLRLGSPDTARETRRDAQRFPQIDHLQQDLRFAVRTLWRDRAFTVTAVLVLAIAIGANTAVYGVVRAVLLDGPPFEEPDRLVWIANDIPGAPSSLGLSLVTTMAVVWREWQQRTTSFEGIAAYDAFFACSTRKLTGRGDPVRLSGVHVSRNFLDVLGVPPRIGRGFTEAEMQREGPKAVVLLDGLWRRRFAADPAVVGQPITIDGQPVTVVGVMPPDFDFSSTFSPGTRVDMLTPLVFEEVSTWGNTLAVVGRLKPGVTTAQAQQDLEHANAGIKRDFPTLTGYGARAAALGQYLHGGVRRSLLLLWGAVVAMLLVACANLANLILTRSAGRQREFAVRVALGAGRARLLRQLLTESLLLCVAGAALGIAAARLVLKVVSSADLLAIPLLGRARLDGSVLAFTIALIAGTTLLVGLLPGLRMSRASLPASLKAGARGSGGRAERRLVGSLVTGEIALACALLVVASVLARSLLNVLDVDLGFRPEHALAVNIDPPAGRFNSLPQLTGYFAGAVSAVEALPGVVAAGVTDTLPLDRNRSWRVIPQGRAIPDDQILVALVSRVGPGVIRAMGMTLLSGRDIAAADRDGAQPVAVINETMARALFGRESPLGRTVGVGGTDSLIIGVVADVRHGSLESDAGFEVYLPLAQRGFSTVDLVVRTTGDAPAVAGDLRAALTRFDPTLPVDDIRPVSYLVERAVSPRRFVTWLIGAFAGVALALASLGVYGVVAASVGSRTREIGIRMALGAAPLAVGRQLAGETALLAITGIAAGVAGALVASRLISTLVFGVPTIDPVSFSAAPAGLLAVALAAGLLPAIRAARTNPTTALRVE